MKGRKMGKGWRGWEMKKKKGNKTKGGVGGGRQK